MDTVLDITPENLMAYGFKETRKHNFSIKRGNTLVTLKPIDKYMIGWLLLLGGEIKTTKDTGITITTFEHLNYWMREYRLPTFSFTILTDTFLKSVGMKPGDIVGEYTYDDLFRTDHVLMRYCGTYFRCQVEIFGELLVNERITTEEQFRYYLHKNDIYLDDQLGK